MMVKIHESWVGHLEKVRREKRIKNNKNREAISRYIDEGNPNTQEKILEAQQELSPQTPTAEEK